MSLGRRAYWASGERRRGLCSTAHPANDVERGCSLAFVLLVDSLALDGGAREAAPLPLALRLAFDGGGDGHRLAALDLPLRRRLLGSGEFTNDTAVWQGLPQGAVWST